MRNNEKRKRDDDDDFENERDNKTRRIYWPPDFESMASKVPTDVWDTIFNFVPDLRDFLMARRVNNEWLTLIKAIVVKRYIMLLMRSDAFTRAFSNMSHLIAGALDLSYNNRIENETLSLFSHVTKLDLTQNYKITDEGAMNLINLKNCAPDTT